MSKPRSFLGGRDPADRRQRMTLTAYGYLCIGLFSLGYLLHFLFF